MVTAIIAAAGLGTRSGLNTNKVFCPMADGQTVLEHALTPFELEDRVTEIIVAVSDEYKQKAEEIAKEFSTPIKIITGGSTRTATVRLALAEASNDVVLIHDGARPFLTEKSVYKCINDVFVYGTSVLAVPCTDTIGEADGDDLLSTSRSNKYSIQTPQGFIKSQLMQAFELAGDRSFTDEAGVYCKYIGKAHITEGDRNNIKLTYPEDFAKIRPPRSGTGYDLHILTEGRKLVLGGVTIPHDKGLLGHSDADALAHAIADAMLSAAGLRDIGYYFSDKDPAYEGISSMILLEKVRKMVAETGYKVNNVAAVIMAEKPKLNPFVPQMKNVLSEILRISAKDIGITCTTSEKVGFIGREEGIAVSAICTLIPVAFN